MVYRICFVLQLLLNREMYGRTKQSSNQDVVFITFRCNESSKKSVKIVYLFCNLHTPKCKENIEYLNINHEPVTT